MDRRRYRSTEIPRGAPSVDSVSYPPSTVMDARSNRGAA